MTKTTLNTRKGEILSDPTDKRSRSEKQSALKKVSRSRIFNLSWQTQANKVIKEKIKHYKKTGNAWKLQIYQSKLKDQSNIIEKIGNVFS